MGAVGFGCMSFGGIYGATDKAESFAALERALDLGVTHLDTALIYGNGVSETIIGEFIKGHPGRFTIATKAGIVSKPHRHFNNRPEYLRGALESSLKRLGVDQVDLSIFTGATRRSPSRTRWERSSVSRTRARSAA